MTGQPRLVVSAPSSGHGKTAIAVGLLAAAASRGVQAAGFKVGPDHTDAAYLGLAAGRPGRNLDPRLVGAQRIAPLFAHGASGAQFAVIEGAMGLFDSLTGQPEVDGTAAVAATLRAPVVLVVDVAAMGHSLAALVHGFRMFDEMVHLGGVILNRVASPRHEQMLRTALDDIGMPVLGALRRGDLPNVLPARAHGPVPVAHRTVEASRAVRRLGEAVAGGLDLDRLMALAGSAPALPGPIWTPAEAIGGDGFEQRPIVALAGGPGAPYTYVETAELLTAAGADVVVVDPLRDETLPSGTRALVVGAGLPESYAEELSANRRLCNAVAKFAHDGWPVVAEGVALPWLSRDFDGRPMCAVLDASATTGDETVAGYREATAPTTSPLAPAGARITGYKQHRAIVTPRAGAVPAWTWSGGNPEGFVWRQVHASQLGLHWAAAPEIAKRLVAAAIAGPAGGPEQPFISGVAYETPHIGDTQQLEPVVSGTPHDVPVSPESYGRAQVVSAVPYVQVEGFGRPPVVSGVPHDMAGRPRVVSGVPHDQGGPVETYGRAPVVSGVPHDQGGPVETYGRAPVVSGVPHDQAGPVETYGRAPVVSGVPHIQVVPVETYGRAPVISGVPYDLTGLVEAHQPPVSPGSPEMRGHDPAERYGRAGGPPEMYGRRPAVSGPPQPGPSGSSGVPHVQDGSPMMHGKPLPPHMAPPRAPHPRPLPPALPHQQAGSPPVPRMHGALPALPGRAGGPPRPPGPGNPHAAGSMPVAGGQPGPSDREPLSFEERGLADTADIPTP